MADIRDRPVLLAEADDLFRQAVEADRAVSGRTGGPNKALPESAPPTATKHPPRREPTVGPRRRRKRCRFMAAF